MTEEIAHRTPASTKSWVLRVLFYTMLVVFFVSLAGAETFLLIPLNLLFGWVTYSFKALPKLSLQPVHLAIFVSSLAGFVLGVHVFARWLNSRPTDSFANQLWPWRRTFALCGLLMVFFGAGIAVIGSFHQTAWLATFSEPWMNEMSRFRAITMLRARNLVRDGHDGKWTNAQMYAAVQQHNAELDGQVRFHVAHDSQGEWLAIISENTTGHGPPVYCSPREYNPHTDIDGETVEELLESCARFTPPETAKPEAAR